MPAHPSSLAAPTVPCFSIPLDENGFVDWLIDSEPGDTLVYYRGHLSRERMPSVKTLDDASRRKLAAVANRVLAAEAQGLVMPVQRRVRENEWLYLAIRTRGPMRSTHKSSPTTPHARSFAHV
jgi:hypothetical protein